MIVGCAAPRSDAERANAIAGRVWSPYCPGRLLTDCPTKQADELRNEILERVQDNQSDAAIRDWIASDFGPGALADGTSPLAWAVPALLIGFGAVLAGRRLLGRGNTLAHTNDNRKEIN